MRWKALGRAVDLSQVPAQGDAVFLAFQVRSYFPVYMTHFWNPPQGEAKRDNNPRERSCALCAVCGQELFQRLMSRGLSDRGRLHILFHPPGPLGCLVSLKLK